jgi:hypothetical protein
MGVTNMKKYIIGVLTGIMIITLMFISTIAVQGKGGGGEKSLNVCWMQGSTEVKAFFKITNSGLIQQFRYEPDDKHLIFKPKGKFNDPMEAGWFSWNYTEGKYNTCVEWDGASLDEVLSPGAYWVKIVNQNN